MVTIWLQSFALVRSLPYVAISHYATYTPVVMVFPAPFFNSN